MTTVAIIGAGPAGCGAAIGLAQKGCAVTLFERKVFPRVKVCGEYVSPAGTEALERLVAPDELIAAGARRVGSMVLEVGDHSIEWSTPRPAWCLSRKALDELLRNRAIALGVNVDQPVTVRGVDWQDNCAIVSANETEQGFDFVVHADGLGRLDEERSTPMAPGIVGFKCHYRPDRTVDGVRMRACAGAYVGTVGVEDGLATCALVADARLVKGFGSRTDAMLASLWPDWDPSCRETDWLSCGVARSRYTEPGHPRSVRLGNAAAAVDPVGGEGIGLALWSARVFVDAFDGNLAEAKRTLASAYRDRLRVRRWACRVAAESLMRPKLMRALLPVLGRRGEGSAAMGLWYRLSGKPG
ncbi:MAG: FAD-dependent monooxygenase [Planctomycetota bacterium]